MQPGQDDAYEWMAKFGVPPAEIERVRKGAVTPMDSTSSIADQRTINQPILERTRALSVLGRLDFPQAPMGSSVPVEVTPMSAAWLLPATKIPVSAMSLTDVTLSPTQIATIAVISRALARIPAAFPLVERDLDRAVIATGDGTLFDSVAAIPHGRPAGLLNGLSPLGGGSPSMIEDDVASLLTAISSGKPSRPKFVTNVAGALYLATQRDPTSGQLLFPGIGVDGGKIFGAELIVGIDVPDILAAVDCDRVVLADAGLDLVRAEATALQMDDAPSSAASSLVSMFQTSSIAIKVVRWLYWAKASDAVAYITLPS